MILIILGGFVSLFISLIFFLPEILDLHSKTLPFFIPIVSIITGCAIGGGISGIAGEIYYDSKDQLKPVSQTERIYSVFNNNSISGSFFLGIGTVESQNYYYYYTKEERGYKRRKLHGGWNDVYINEKENISNPSVKIVKYKPYDTWASEFFIFPNNFSDTVVFNVPKGTVYKGYKVK